MSLYPNSIFLLKNLAAQPVSNHAWWGWRGRGSARAALLRAGLIEEIVDGRTTTWAITQAGQDRLQKELGLLA